MDREFRTMGYQVNQTNASPTLDALFQRITARNRDAIALVDPLNKPRITGQPQLRLTYEQADRAISALAAHFIEAGLPTHSVIAVQLPNTVEFMLTVLAAHRAGLVVALFPLLWRQSELVSALNRTSARAIVTTSRIDGVIYADLAMNAAAEAFSIRHVCGFGNDLPEGMASLDQAIARPSNTVRSVVQDGRKAAIISFDVTSEGFRAVPRTHLSVIAGGLALSLESDVSQGSIMMSAFAPSSFAGLASSLAIWLLSGGTLLLHHPFDADVIEQQIREHGCDSLIAQPPRDYVDTEYVARLDRSTGAISITAPPSGVMAVGGYRFLASDLQEWGRRLGQGALLTALPDRLSGHRLAGRAQDNARAREALLELGLNPLMVEAFRDRTNAA